MLTFIFGFLAGIVFTFAALIAITVYLIYDSEDARNARTYERQPFIDDCDDDDP